MNNCCKQTLADVLKIIDEHKRNCFTMNNKHLEYCSCCRIDILDFDEMIEEIKNIQSQGTKLSSSSRETEATYSGDACESKKDKTPDTNTQNIHTGGVQSTGGLTGGEVKSEETYNGVNSQKPVICKPEPLCPPANNQNLKGCGKYIEDMDGVCGIDGLCEKCQGKVR